MQQKTGFRTIELYLAYQYASMNGKKYFKISENLPYLMYFSA